MLPGNTAPTGRQRRQGCALVRWIMAVTLAASLHVSIAAWALIGLSEPEPTEEADGAALPIDISALTVTSTEEIAVRTAPPSPEIAPQQAAPAETSEAPPPAAEKTETLIEQKSIEESEVALPKPAPEEIKEETETTEQEKPTPPQPQQTVAAAAQEATALPSVPAPQAPVARSATVGITPSQRKSRSTWEKKLLVHLDRHKRYPRAARESRATGEVVVEFTMTRSGGVIARRLEQSSGSAALDAEAMALLLRATPLPPPPPDVGGETFRLLVPIRFRLR
jgi:protein TonB